MRAALYARVSTEDQATEGYSLDAQIKKLELYCRSRNWSPYGLFIEEGYSGRNTQRPEYMRMMSLMKEWDVIVVMKMDRIHRNSVNFTAMMDSLKKNGKEFNSFYEKFDTTTANGRFVMDLMQRIAQLESEQIGERVKMGMERKAKLGDGALGSGHPYGYEYISGTLRIKEDEAETVRGMYEMRKSGLSLNEISRTLNGNGIRAKKGGLWNKQSVHKILSNPIYIGKLVWDGVVRDANHEPIIDRSLFETMNGVLNE
ncbi:MAG: recombinase family protein [Methanomassiliicoccaceae archaeon]|jgi:DNA invertase Pin-like site-specific DNA recombinase|nr:recombinase family protein [Methanomassiliicoccaceae archaeon]